MSVSIAAMTLAELQAWMALHPVYVTVAEAVQAGALVATPASGLGGVAIYATEAASAVADATVTGSTIIDFAEAAELLAAGKRVTTSGTGLLKGSTGYRLSAILGVDMGIVAAAVAPLLGVALGASWYATNPDLWTKISQRLLPFCYPDTTKIPTWAEVAGAIWATSIPKAVIDAIKGVFEEEGVPLGTYEVTNIDVGGGVTVTGGTVFGAPHTYEGVSYGSGAQYFAWFDSYKGVAFSDSQFEGSTRSSTEPYYYYKDYAYPVRLTDPTFDAKDGNGVLHFDEAIRAILGLTEPSPISTTYPPGTSKWSGTTPTEIPLSDPAITSTDGTEQPMVPISFPQEVPDPDPEAKPEEWPEELPAPIPAESPDPDVQPDPTIVTEPEKQVEPYVMPTPIPWEIYAPEPGDETQTDPTLDPTTPRPPDEIIVPPPIDLGPSPIGISPWPAMPGTPMAFAQNVGLITVYHPTPAQLYAFESWLWVTLANADINTVWNNPFDGVITLFELYCTPTDVGNRTIHSGFLDSGINSAIISRYTEINCGTYAIPEYYGNYLDYSPYSKAHVYLPFIGVQELNVDDIVGHAVNITYRIDEYNGSCIAMITVAKTTEVNGETVEYSNTMYQFSGNCAVELPISGGSQAQIKAGLMMANAYQTAANISAGANLIGGVGSLLAGNIGGAIQGLGSAASSYAFGQANALSHMLSGKSTVQKSGQFGSSYGAMGIKVPFITITRPKQIQVPNYNELYGYPAHKMVTVGACTGFLRCREVHVISPTASDEEKALIENLMKSGVYVTE